MALKIFTLFEHEYFAHFWLFLALFNLIDIHAKHLQQRTLLFAIVRKGTYKRCASWLEVWLNGFENIYSF